MRDRPAIELVVTDLDGTLLDAGERIHPLALAAVTGLRRSGMPVLVATGRRSRTAAPLLAGAGLSLPGIYQDGAVGVDADGGRFLQVAFAAEEAARVLAALVAGGLPPLVVVDRPEADLVVSAGYPGSGLHLARNRRWLADLTAERAVAGETVLSFNVMGADPALIAIVEPDLAGLAAITATPDRIYGGASLQVRPHGISKWTGVLAYCEREGIDQGRVLAAGDGANDLELLGAAAVACVMSDGVPEAVALADHILPPAADGGWARIPDLVR